MRLPDDVATKIADLGRKVLDDKEEDDVVDVARDGAVWLTRSQPDFSLDVLSDWMRKSVKRWIYAQMREGLRNESDEGTQLILPFPDLPPYLEVAPGVKKHQAVTTRKDWDNAIAIYQNRHEQAGISLRRLRDHYQQLPADFVGDVQLADVLDHLEGQQAA